MIMKKDWFHEAAERVYDDYQLREYYTVLLHDWPREPDHLEWVATAPRDELLDWAITVSKE
jgi:hypothetical protein